MSRIAKIYDAMTDAGARRYKRERDLPKLIHLFPHELDRVDRAGHLRILARLRLALRGQRELGRQEPPHWAYDRNLHLGLIGAFKAETKAFKDRQLLAAILEEPCKSTSISLS